MGGAGLKLTPEVWGIFGDDFQSTSGTVEARFADSTVEYI